MKRSSHKLCVVVLLGRRRVSAVLLLMSCGGAVSGGTWRRGPGVTRKWGNKREVKMGE